MTQESIRAVPQATPANVVSLPLDTEAATAGTSVSDQQRPTWLQDVEFHHPQQEIPAEPEFDIDALEDSLNKVQTEYDRTTNATTDVIADANERHPAHSAEVLAKPRRKRRSHSRETIAPQHQPTAHALYRARRSESDNEEPEYPNGLIFHCVDQSVRFATHAAVIITLLLLVVKFIPSLAA